jgi:hypothetical protein
MTDFIQPLELQTWIINVFAGDNTYFSAIAILVITSLAAYFRMNGIGMFFMLGVFLMIFGGYVPASLPVFIAIIGGLLIGYTISKIVKN